MGSTGDSPVAMSYFHQMQTEFKPPLIAHDNAFLGDVVSSQDNDAKSPISCGFYRLEKGGLSSYFPWKVEMGIIADRMMLDCRHAAGVRVHVP